jgi:acetyl/propionyl-CoA carboxylase alpha subunit
MEIPIYYDPMLAKLIAYGDTREEAIQRLVEAIDHFEIEGVATTLPFGKFVLQHEAFKTAQFDTHFVQKYYSAEKLQSDDEAQIAAALSLYLFKENKQKLVAVPVGESDWYLKR